MINNDWLEQIRRYSFIDDCKREGLMYCFYYEVKGKQVVKKLPLRANGVMVQNLIKKIKKETEVKTYGKGRNSRICIV